jgi:hypothetical protein
MWTFSHYDNRLGCIVYYDPDSPCSYYWCEPDGCFHPISYCPYGRYSW